MSFNRNDAPELLFQRQRRDDGAVGTGAQQQRRDSVAALDDQLWLPGDSAGLLLLCPLRIGLDGAGTLLLFALKINSG